MARTTIDAYHERFQRPGGFVFEDEPGNPQVIAPSAPLPLPSNAVWYDGAGPVFGFDRPGMNNQHGSNSEGFPIRTLFEE